MKTTNHLINNIIGQLEGINRMLERKEDCIDVIVQMKAAKSAMENAMQKFVEENFTRCSGACKGLKEKERLEKLLATLIKK